MEPGLIKKDIGKITVSLRVVKVPLLFKDIGEGVNTLLLVITLVKESIICIYAVLSRLILDIGADVGGGEICGETVELLNKDNFKLIIEWTEETILHGNSTVPSCIVFSPLVVV